MHSPRIYGLRASAYHARPAPGPTGPEPGERPDRSEEHTSELQSPCNLVCRLLLEKKRRKPEVFLLQIGRSDGIRTPRLLLPGHNETAKSDERVRRNQITNAADSSSERAATWQESSDAAPCAYQNKEHQSDQDLFPGTGTDVERGEHRQVVTTIRKRHASNRKNLCCAGALSRHTLLSFVHRPTQKLGD